MPSVPNGYQPDTKAPSARRADFDLLRRLTRLEEGGGAGLPPGGDPGEVLTIDSGGNPAWLVPSGGAGGADEVWIGTSAPTNPAIELWYDTDAAAPPGGRLSYTFTQGVAAATWIVEHDLAWFPNVTVIDSGGSTVEGDVAHIDSNTLTLTFSAAFTGTAYLS